MKEITCKKCNQPAFNYSHGICRKCYDKQYYINHRKEILNYKHEYFKRQYVKEKYRKRSKLYYKINKKKILDKKREYANLPENKEKKQKYRRLWYLKNRNKSIKISKKYNNEHKKEIRIKRFIKMHGCPPSKEYIETWKP